MLVSIALAFCFPAAVGADGKSSITAPMSVQRANHAGAVLGDGRVLVMGGASNVIQHDSAEIYVPSSQTWTPAGTMITPRVDHTATLLHSPDCNLPAPPTWCGKVLVAGGVAAASGLASAELYDPASNEWSATGSMAHAHARHTATPLPDGRVLVIGGSDSGAAVSPTPATEIYDPATGLWTEADPLNLARESHAATLLGDGRVLATGGWELDGPDDPRPDLEGSLVPTRATEIYDPGADEWTEVDPLVVGRRDHTVSALPSGDALLAGGFDPSGNLGNFGPRPVVDLFDVTADQWDHDDGRWLNSARANHTATLIPGGGVWALAGRALGNPTPSAERYDPDADAWSYGGPLQQARGGHFAALLELGCGSICGRVLVVGGRGANNAVLAGAELYDPDADTVPGPVAGVQATAVSQASIRLRFAAAGAVEGYPPPAGDYVVKQSRRSIDDPGAFAAARALCGGTCSFGPASVGSPISLLIGGLRPSATYHYAIRARDADGDLGPISAPASARTRRDTIAPAPVRGLRARPLRGGKVRLRFRAPGSNGRQPPPARAYLVRQSFRPINSKRRWRRARPLCGGVCRFGPARVGQLLRLTVKGLTRGASVHFAIRARDPAGNVSRRSSFPRVRVR